MGRLFPLLVLANLVLVVLALIDCLATDEHQVRGLPKVLWALVILLFPLVGPIGWYLAGRPRPEHTGGAAGRGRSRPRRRPLAPDDDPEFLRRLSERFPPPEQAT